MVDQRDPPDGEPDGERTILIDCVDADWFDDAGQDIGWFGDPANVPEVDRHLSVVEAHFPGPSGPGPPEAETPEGQWLALEFGEGQTVLHYLNLFAAPLPRGVSRWDLVSPPIEERLDRATGLHDLPDASGSELEDAVAGVADIEAVAVYDVGHGNCNALIHGGRPSMYFDLGGGVLRNAKTFPAALSRFCMGSSPPIVLSHWDFDHWSAGQRDPRVLDRTWIVPRQKMGASHTAFLGRILLRGNVIVWPAGLAAVTSGPLTIERCIGPPSSRNDSGLAVVVGKDDGSLMLLPGDCSYDRIPSSSSMFLSVVVPHHGGRTRSKSIASSDGRSFGRCVYSIGAGNTYHHPFAAVEAAHRAVWAHELKTEHRKPSGLGHVHMYWAAGQLTADPACNGAHCDLTCQQR